MKARCHDVDWHHVHMEDWWEPWWRPPGRTCKLVEVVIHPVADGRPLVFLNGDRHRRLVFAPVALVREAGLEVRERVGVVTCDRVRRRRHRERKHLRHSSSRSEGAIWISGTFGAAWVDLGVAVWWAGLRSFRAVCCLASVCVGAFGWGASMWSPRACVAGWGGNCLSPT